MAKRIPYYFFIAVAYGLGFAMGMMDDVFSDPGIAGLANMAHAVAVLAVVELCILVFAP